MKQDKRQEFSTLIEAAARVREAAYAPYSNFKVGAALQSASGRVFTGCNVENLSYGLTLCAERNAVSSAVAEGESEFSAIAVLAETRHPISPCGACRQVLAEFAPALTVVMATSDGQLEITSLTDLFPRSRTGILDSD